MIQDALPDIYYQLRLNTNRVRICDGRAHDDEENRNLPVECANNNDNLGINRLRAINTSRLPHIACFMIPDSGFVTVPGRATLPGR